MTERAPFSANVAASACDIKATKASFSSVAQPPLTASVPSTNVAVASSATVNFVEYKVSGTVTVNVTDFPLGTVKASPCHSPAATAANFSASNAVGTPSFNSTVDQSL